MADGTETTESVSMPWTSDPIAVRAGQSYRIRAVSENGWNLGNSEPDGERTYTFPDDLEDGP